jgi:hypothetical protein
MVEEVSHKLNKAKEQRSNIDDIQDGDEGKGHVKKIDPRTRTTGAAMRAVRAVTARLKARVSSSSSEDDEDESWGRDSSVFMVEVEVLWLCLDLGECH